MVKKSIILKMLIIMIYSGCEDKRSAEQRKNDWDKKKQLSNHIKSCQKGHSKRKSKKHIK